MMTWNPTDLAYFLEVARTTNISRAAERLGVGQPAVSQAMRRLERAFGVSLLNRYKTGVQLTAAGLRLQEQGASTFRAYEMLRESVVASETEIQGRYILGCHPSVALYSLPLFLRETLAQNNALSIQLMHGLSREVLEAVISFKVDFGIVVNPTRHPDLVIKELCRDEVCFWTAENAIEDVLIYSPQLNQSRSLISKIKNVEFGRHLESSELEVIATLAQEGCGTAILPGRVAQRFSKLRAVRRLPQVQDRICLIYRADRLQSASAKFILNIIRKIKI